MRTKSDMRKWLRRYIERGDALAKIVLSKGEWFLGRAAVVDYEITEAWKRAKRPRPGKCFHNAQTFCLAHKATRYYEGYYLIGGTPMHHAWIVMGDGRVVDFTVEAVLRRARRLGQVYDDRSPLYLGLHVPSAALRERLGVTRHVEPVAEHYFTSKS